MTKTKLPYLEQLTDLAPQGSHVLDYGCGIGSDGLALIEPGYRVEFADFANPSTEYLRCRLKRRRFDAPVHALDREVPGNLLKVEEDDRDVHRELPVAAIARRAARRGLLRYRVLHGRSHLVAYRPAGGA